MKIGILGSGDVGQVLGGGFAQLGHQVKLGSRNPDQDKVRRWVEKTGLQSSTGTFEETARFAELAVLATLWEGTAGAIEMAGPKNLAGKIVIDATNPLDFSSGAPRLAVGHTDSGGEQVQRWISEAHVVKAFNTVGNPHMFKPDFPDGPPDMFICGNDARAKETVTGFLNDFGWSVVDLGAIEMSRYTEPLAMIWITHFFNSGTGNHAFKLLRK